MGDEYSPEVQKRIDRYEKKGYTLMPYTNCWDCHNIRTNRKAPIYFNEESRKYFCTYCGRNWKRK